MNTLRNVIITSGGTQHLLAETQHLLAEADACNRLPALPTARTLRLASFAGNKTASPSVLIGRTEALADAFAAVHDKQWMTIYGQSGVGKTALATELAQRLLHKARYRELVVISCHQQSITSPAALFDALRRALAPEANSTAASVASIMASARGRSFILFIDGLDAALPPLSEDDIPYATETPPVSSLAAWFPDLQEAQPASPYGETSEGVPGNINALMEQIAENLVADQFLLVTSRRPVGSDQEKPRVVSPLGERDWQELLYKEFNACRRGLSPSGRAKGQNAQIAEEMVAKLTDKLDGTPLSAILTARWFHDRCAEFPQNKRPRYRLGELEALSVDCTSNSSGAWSVKGAIGKIYEQLKNDAAFPVRLLRLMVLFPAGIEERTIVESLHHAEDVKGARRAVARLIDVRLLNSEEARDNPERKRGDAGDTAHTPGRLIMLAPVRSALSELLQDNPCEAKKAEIDVLDYYKQIVTDWGDRIGSQDTVAAVDLLMAELPNIHAAIDRTYLWGRTDTDKAAARLTEKLHRLYVWCNIEEGKARLKAAAQVAERNGFTSLLADCLYAQGEIVRRRRLFAEAYAFFHRAEAIYEQVNDGGGTARCWKKMGDVKRRMDEYVPALAFYLRAEVFAKKEGESLFHAEVLRGIGEVYRKTDDLHKALSKFTKARELFQNSGDTLGEAACLRSEAEALRQMAEYDQAAVRYGEALKGFEQLNATLGVARVMRGMGDLNWLQDDYEQAQACYEKAEKLYQSNGDRLGIARIRYSYGQYYRRAQQWDRALAYFNDAESEYISIGSRFGAAQSIRGKGDVYQKKAVFDLAFAAYQQARKIAKEIGSRQLEAESLRGVGDVSTRNEHYEDALAWYDEAGAIYKEIGSMLGYHHTISGRGDALLGLGRRGEAITEYQKAFDFFAYRGSIRAAANAAQALSTVLRDEGRLEEANRYEQDGTQFRARLERSLRSLSDDSDDEQEADPCFSGCGSQFDEDA